MLTDHLSEISDDDLLDANRLIPQEQVESRKNFSRQYDQIMSGAFPR